MIRFNCVSCGGKIGVDDQYAGRRRKCPKCGNPNIVPAASTAPASAPGGTDDILAEALRAQAGAAPPPAPTAAPRPALPRPAPNVFRPTMQPPVQRAESGSNRTLLFIVGVVVSAIIIGGGVYQGMRSAEARKDLNDELAKAKEAIKAHPGDSAVAGQQLKNLADAADKASANMSGEEKQGAQAGAIALRLMGDMAKPYNQATEALAKAGNLKPSTLTSRDAIVTRLALVKALADANEQFDRDVADLPQHLTAALDKAGIDDNVKQATLKGINSSNRLALIRQVRQSDRDVTQASTDMLNVFLDEWGKWKLAGDTPRFNDHQAVVRYNDAFHRLQTAAAVQKGQIAQVQAAH